MKFKVETVGSFYKNEKDIKRLKSIGFVFKEAYDPSWGSFISDETTINIDSLADIVKFTETHGQIILEGNLIRIYDDYNE